MTIDVVIGGALMNRSKDATYNLIEDMSKNHHSQGSVSELTAKDPKKVEFTKLVPSTT